MAQRGGQGSAHSTRRLRTSCAAVSVKVVAQAWGSAMRALACARSKGAQAGQAEGWHACSARVTPSLGGCAPKLPKACAEWACAPLPAPCQFVGPSIHEGGHTPPPPPTCRVSSANAAEPKAQAGERMGTNSLFGFTRTWGGAGTTQAGSEGGAKMLRHRLLRGQQHSLSPCAAALAGATPGGGHEGRNKLSPWQGAARQCWQCAANLVGARSTGTTLPSRCIHGIQRFCLWLGPARSAQLQTDELVGQGALGRVKYTWLGHRLWAACRQCSWHGAQQADLHPARSQPIHQQHAGPRGWPHHSRTAQHARRKPGSSSAAARAAQAGASRSETRQAGKHPISGQLHRTCRHQLGRRRRLLQPDEGV